MKEKICDPFTAVEELQDPPGARFQFNEAMEPSSSMLSGVQHAVHQRPVQCPMYCVTSVNRHVQHTLGPVQRPAWFLSTVLCPVQYVSCLASRVMPGFCQASSVLRSVQRRAAPSVPPQRLSVSPTFSVQGSIMYSVLPPVWSLTPESCLRASVAVVEVVAVKVVPGSGTDVENRWMGRSRSALY